MPKPTQPVSIAGIEFDALIDETKTLSADIPAYPTEEGFEVNDTIILKPIELSMTLFLTNTPVTWKSKGGPSHVQDILKQLEDLYFEHKPVTVSTSERDYVNMGITGISIPKTIETGTSREITIDFQEIRTTESKTVTIPATIGNSGKTGVNAGTANTKISQTPPVSSGSESNSGGDGSKSSIAYGLAKSAGLF